MALTRKLLKGMGLTDEQVDTIIEAHTDTTDGLKAEVARLKADAEKLPEIQKELDEIKAKGDDGWKEKHDKVKAEYTAYKDEIEAKESRAAKEAAVRAYFEGKGITGGNLIIAMRGCGAEIDAAEVEDGNVKDTAALDELIKGDYSRLVTTVTKQGIPSPNPPMNIGGGGKTKEEIMAIKDPATRHAEIAKNPEAFGLTFTNQT